jgi:hypothetical protein
MNADIEFEPFVVDGAPLPEPPPRRPVPPWRWGVVGLVVGLVVGYAATIEGPGPTEDPIPPLASDGVAVPGVPAPGVVPTPGQAGIADTIHLLVEREGGAALVRLDPTRDTPVVLEGFDPATRPDASGRYLGRLVEHSTGAFVEVRRTGGAPGVVRFGAQVTSWVWDDHEPGLIAFSEAPDPRHTDLVRLVVLAPGDPVAIQLIGSWRLAALSAGTLVGVEEGGAIGLVSSPGSLYQRTAEPPVVVTGVINGSVHAVSGDERRPVVTDLRGTATPWPAPWWDPALGEAVASPGGWGLQRGDGAVVVSSPAGTRQVVGATAMGGWTSDGRRALIPQGSTLLVLDTATGARVRLEVGAPILSVWTTSPSE